MSERNLEMGDGMTVLAVLDGRPGDKAVVERAAELVGRGRGQLLLLRTLPVIEESLPRDGGGAPPIEPWEQMNAAAGRAREGLKRLRERLEVSARVLIRFGEPVEVASEVTKEYSVDMVVTSVPKSRRLPWLKRDFRLLAAVAVPVTLVPQRSGPDGAEPRRSPMSSSPSLN
jgi:hypothetical protein